MGLKNYLKFVLIILIFSNCEKEETNTISSMLQNDKGWYSIQYKRVDIGDEAEFENKQPYIIIGEYGSGFKINEDGICHINYSDGIAPIEEGSITREWIKIGEDEILFKSQSSEDIKVKIIEISTEALWIQYEKSGDNWEYKLKRIE